MQPCGALIARLPTVVRGAITTGAPFVHDTVLENIGRGGLYLVSPEAVDLGAPLFLLVRFGDRQDVPAARVALRGRVVRIGPQSSGGRGVAVAFTWHRFLKGITPRAGGGGGVKRPRRTP